MEAPRLNLPNLPMCCQEGTVIIYTTHLMVCRWFSWVSIHLDPCCLFLDVEVGHLSISVDARRWTSPRAEQISSGASTTETSAASGWDGCGFALWIWWTWYIGTWVHGYMNNYTECMYIYIYVLLLQVFMYSIVYDIVSIWIRHPRFGFMWNFLNMTWKILKDYVEQVEILVPKAISAFESGFTCKSTPGSRFLLVESLDWKF